MIIFTVYMCSNFHTNTCDKIPELRQKCLLKRPDSFPTVRSQKGVESGKVELFLNTLFLYYVIYHTFNACSNEEKDIPRYCYM